MGANVAKQTTKIINESIIDASTEYLSETLHSQNLNVKVDADQVISVVNSQFNNCDNYVFGNKYDGSVNVFSSMSNAEVIDFESFLKNSMESIIQNASEQMNKDFNLFQANVNVQENELTQKLISDLSTTIAKKTQQIFNASVTQNVTQKIEIEGSSFTCSDAVGDTSFRAENSINIRTVVANVMEDASITELVKKIATTQGTEVENINLQTNDGLSPLDFFLGPLLMLVAFGAILLILLLFLPKLLLILNPKKAWAKKIDNKMEQLVARGKGHSVLDSYSLKIPN